MTLLERQAGYIRQFAHVAKTGHFTDRLVLWIDGIDVALETAVDQILQHNASNTRRSSACTYHGNPLWMEHFVEMENGHG